MRERRAAMVAGRSQQRGVRWRPVMLGLLAMFLAGYAVLWLRIAMSVHSQLDSDGGIVTSQQPVTEASVPWMPSGWKPEKVVDSTKKNDGGAEYRQEQDSSQWIYHDVVKSNTGLFESVQAYVTDNGASVVEPTSDANHLVLFLVGYGEFTAQRHASDLLDHPLEVPDLECWYTSPGSSSPERVPAYLHRTGTAFEHKIHKGRVKYSGEKTVLISCPLKQQSVASVRAKWGQDAGEVQIKSTNGVFDSRPVKAQYFVSQNWEKEKYRLVQCSSAIHHMTSTQWLIEWVEYHLALGFDHLDVYLYKVPPLVRQVADHYVSKGVMTAHDWSGVPDAPSLKGVNIMNWEHGQRLTRNDCYFRNRGRAKYVAFSDVDELWAPSAQGDLVLAGGSFHLLGDKDRASFSKPVDHWINFFEAMNARDSHRIGFAFKSVTVPPVSIAGLSKEETSGDKEGSGKMMDAFKQDIRPAPDFGLLLGRIQIAEAKCQQPYNCGLFHKGRQKYMLRTARGSVNPNVALFYHAINEDYDGVAGRLMHQVPSQIGHLRHYAGHFKHSRLGGLPWNNRLHRPISRAVLGAIRSSVERDSSLRGFYFDSGAVQREEFLRLSSLDDAWRFSKSSDDKAGAREARKRAVQNNRRERLRRRDAFMTFDQYMGRLNNQLISYDWAFRISHGVRRTLYLETDVSKREFWIGLPESRDEEDHHTSLWNVTGLREVFHFVTTYDVQDQYGSLEQHPVLGKPVDQLDPKCVWLYDLVDEDKRWKNIAQWAAWASQLPECKERIHLKTNNGLVHPYRSDTRFLGVHPLLFWDKMRPSGHLQGLVDRFLDQSFHGRAGLRHSLGIHSRSHNSYGPEKAAKAKKSCERLARKPLDHAQRYQKARKGFCSEDDPLQPDQSLVWPIFSLGLSDIFKERKLLEMCEIDEPTVEFAFRFSREYLGQEQPLNILLASDHENKQVDDLVYSKGGVNYNYDADKVFQSDERRKQYHDEAKSNWSWRINIQGVLIDMLLLSKVAIFFGNPGSTLSQVVCYWRLADATNEMRPEISNACGLVLLSTGGSPDKEFIKC